MAQMAGRAGTGQKCHLKVPGATTWNKTTSSNSLFLTCFSPPSNKLHVHLFSLSARIVKKTFSPVLSAHTSTLGAISAFAHPLLSAIPQGSRREGGRVSMAVSSMVTVSAPPGCTQALLSPSTSPPLCVPSVD